MGGRESSAAPAEADVALGAAAVAFAPPPQVPPAVAAAAGRVRTALEGFDIGPLDDLHTLVEIACLTHCRVYLMAGCLPSYCPVECDENVAGVIVLDAASSQGERVRQMAHELTHHVLRWWAPLLSEEDEAALSRLGPRPAVEEWVCRQVEQMVCGDGEGT